MQLRIDANTAGQRQNSHLILKHNINFFLLVSYISGRLTFFLKLLNPQLTIPFVLIV